MGVRFRRSLSLGGGVRMSLSKSGVGISMGGRGMRYSIHSSGRTTRTIGVPGTGLAHVSSGKVGSTGRPRRRQQVTLPAASAVHILPSPGWLSGKADRRYHEGVKAYLLGDVAAAFEAFEACLSTEPRAVSAHLFAAICAGKLDMPDGVQVAHLEAAVQSPDPIPDRLQDKYLPRAMATLELTVRITSEIWAQAPFDSVGATLMLAEHYQESGRLDEAIGLLQQLHTADPEDIVVSLSLADLYAADGDYEAVLETVATARNDSNIGAALVHRRAAAMFALGHVAGSLESFKEALAKTADRDPELLKIIRYERAVAYEAGGQKAKAKADLERIFAVDPGYRDVRDRLAALTA